MSALDEIAKIEDAIRRGLEADFRRQGVTLRPSWYTMSSARVRDTREVVTTVRFKEDAAYRVARDAGWDVDEGNTYDDRRRTLKLSRWMYLPR